MADRVVLVTGSSRGIGRSIAQRFAGEGATVAVHYNSDRTMAERTLATLPAGPHLLVQADLASADAAMGVVNRVVGECGRLDVLVNNAGVYEQHRVSEVDSEVWTSVWRRTLGVNLVGAANASFAAAKEMIRQRSGRIVNVSSRGAFRGEPDAPAYAASKAGLNAMSQSLAQALAPYGVLVYVVAPGWVETDMASRYLDGAAGDAIRRESPLGRVARPEEIANVVAFLASGQADFLTGSIVDANGASYLRS